MLTIEECRKILGKKYKNCTDKQIKAIREWLYTLAKIDGSRSERIKNQSSQALKNTHK